MSSEGKNTLKRDTVGEWWRKKLEVNQLLFFKCHRAGGRQQEKLAKLLGCLEWFEGDGN